MNRFFSFVFTVCIIATAATAAIAQDQEGSENSLLPEIDPQDIEIRSQFRAQFPGLRRQPILGFDPTPRVYQIDPNRVPFMESEEQVVADLPVSELSRPDPPAYTPPHYSDDINLFSRLGFGSYTTPEAQLWGVTRLGDKSYVGGDLDFSSSDGHLDNQQSSFRFLDASARYVTKLSSESRLEVNGGVRNSFNNMFDLPATAMVPDAARKEYSGFNMGVNFQQFKNTITGWKAQANIRYYDTQLKNAGMFSGTSEERVYNASLAKRWAGGNVNETFTVKAGARGGNFTNNTPATDPWLTARAGMEYERLFNYETKITADASAYYVMDAFSNAVYPGLSLTAEHPVMERLTLSVKVVAEPTLQTIEQFHTQNRFLNVDNVLRHAYRINGHAEATLKYSDLGTLNFGAAYENISDHPVFVREEQTGNVGPANPLFYEAMYTDIYRVKAYAGVTQQVVSDRFRVNAKVYLQSPQIQDGGQIPFEEKVGVNAGVTVRPFEILTFEAWADYVGSRKTYLTDETLDGFFMLGGRADVQVTNRFGAYIKGVNLLNQDYQVWQGYTERPFQIYGGITVKL
ncbi:MAG: hypothetical protein U5J63_04070 [Fodinibius sp.]|nr:hypothetical protein [Fodinibius sp.]